MHTYSLDDLKDFLLEAKRATYAGHMVSDLSSRPGSIDLEYRKGDFYYLDSYLGNIEFSGEEAVWFRGEAVWSMNYWGRTFGDPFSGDFLKSALSKGSPEYPYRGPAEYAEFPYSYRMQVDGDFFRFNGYEEISHDGRPVYDLYFHGGRITKV